jgi:hypothetical protein
MRVVNFTNVDPAEWDAVVEASPFAWLYHLSTWVTLERKHWFPECHAFMIQSDDGKPIAILPLYISEQGLTHVVERLLHSGIHRHTGLATIPSLSRKELRRVQEFAVQEVFRIAGEVKADRIQLNAQNLAPANLPPFRQEIPFFVEDFHFYFGLKFNSNSMDPAPGEMNCNSDQVVFLEQSESQLFENIESSAQRAIRKGVKKGVEVVEADDVINFQQLMELREDAAQRTNQELLSTQYYKDIMTFADKKQHKILLALVNEKIVGGIELLMYKSGCNYFGGFGLNEELNLRYFDVLHWNAILWSKHCGLKYYRLGPHFPDMPVDSAIYKKGRFKKKFGGQPFHILQGSCFLSPEKYVESAAQTASAASSDLPLEQNPLGSSITSSQKLSILRRVKTLIAAIRKQVSKFL